ncbi:ExeM/NucH family extracellular endonuclease [Brevibacterium sp. BRM-1]|uniref:ExeM/NucH family extracellular endonuclease n=1 Tax=Brevibacterium sp. BRM-1 TaxID=2999062 RepID=UPI00227FAB08|nr:ExeM/NucH family extracellular endonuclease [Brevibacterium sp. BRM-1]WAL39240.1 ExeM/NucH family extracellular endonuclease [Brevibacterium sp. BRM-1]
MIPQTTARALAAAGTAAGLIAAPCLAPAALAGPVAQGAAQISEIAYAGDDSTDFIELAAPAGTDLSGWQVGSVSRGGSVQAPAYTTTLPAGTAVGPSGALAVRVPVSNTVKEGSAADGAYGPSAFAIDATGALVDFEQVGGSTGGRGITASGGSQTPQALRGRHAQPTGAAAGPGASIARTAAAWAAGAPTPDAVADAPAPEPTATGTGTSAPTPAPTSATPVAPTAIADIQGTGDTSPMAGQTVTARGVVTASYPTGGLSGYYIQTPGSGGDAHGANGPSDGIFVYSREAATIGRYVEVTGTVGEHYGQTQIAAAGAATPLAEAATAPKPVGAAFPEDPAQREALEGMLVQPGGDITVTDNYATNQYGEVGLANGGQTLRQATDAARPGSAEAKRLEADNARRSYLLDDGGTANFLSAAKDTPVPYLSANAPVRVGAKATFTRPVVVGYDHDAWRLQPLRYLGDAQAGDAQPAKFSDTREQAPKQVGGDASIASFNVLNYFPTTGDQRTGCTYYKDRAGTPLTVKDGCDVRGAANAQSFARQQNKIVAAINRIDTSVLSLEEIEDSSKLGKDRDWALAALVTALNDAAGGRKWDYVRSPAALPKNGTDAIRTAFIYQPAEVEPRGESTLLDDEAFHNARAPLAQEFAPVVPAARTARGTGTEAAQAFVAIVNHMKSKGSGTGTGNDDAGDGQGKSNADRVKQANAIVKFAAQRQQAAGTDRAFLLGDLNSYTEEDPMQVFYKAGYTDIGKEKTTEDTYLFGGRTGSLDHVLATRAMLSRVTGADVWNINSVESVGLEYSRYNTNARSLYAPGPFRSSDHDPLVVGFTAAPAPATTAPHPTSGASDSASAPPSAPAPAPSTTGAPTAPDPSTAAPSRPGPSASTAPAPEPTRGPGAPGDDGGGDDTGSGDGDGGRLPRTGAGLGALAAGLALVSAGALLVGAARRRR